MRVVGLMSGTSYDGIDAAVADIELDGDELTLTCVGELSAPYDDELRAEIEAALPPAPTTLEAVCRLDTRIGQAFAELAAQAIERYGGELIVSHGQTVFHAARERDAAARAAGVDRRADRAAGRRRPARARRRRGRPGRAARLAARHAPARRPRRTARGAQPGRDREPDGPAGRVRRRPRERAARRRRAPLHRPPVRRGRAARGRRHRRRRACCSASSPTPTTPAQRPRPPARSTSTPATSTTPAAPRTRSRR